MRPGSSLAPWGRSANSCDPMRATSSRSMSSPARSRGRDRRSLRDIAGMIFSTRPVWQGMRSLGRAISQAITGRVQMAGQGLMRDDFSAAVKDVLAKRVGFRCTLPDCRATTSGPHSDPSRFVNVGVACHITAASEGGPRYDAGLTSDQRMAVENGIWLCQTHAKLIDNDTQRFTVDVLRAWNETPKRGPSRSWRRRVRRAIATCSQPVDD